MLSGTENRLNFACFKFLALINVLPLEFTESGIKSTSRFKRTLWIIALFPQFFHIFFSAWLITTKISQSGFESIPSLTIHFFVTSAPAVAMFIAIQNFVIWPDVAVALMGNMNPDSRLFSGQVRNGPFLGYTYLEIYTMFLACGVYPAAIALGLAYALICTWPITEGFHFMLRSTAVLLEIILPFIWGSFFYFLGVIHVTFMEKVGCTLTREIFNAK